MGLHGKVGALNLKPETTETRTALNLGCINAQTAASPYIPHAHTVGKGRPALKFKIIISLTFAALALTALMFPSQTLQTALLFFTLVICTQAFLRLAAILSPKSKFDVAHHTNPFTRTGPLDWPRYTVLVPLKDEAHMVAGLIRTLSKLDYPKERLQIIFITEEDDPKTGRAVEAGLGAPFEHVVVPRKGVDAPRTKPHALNIAMQQASGDIITIYDAEDAPHPQQLKAAVHAFEAHPKWGAVQAPLDYHNTADSWLAAQFGLEYAAQFHVWIPLMVRLGLPFPLGGTSNHIRRSALNAVRHKTLYWDSYNVTEDADLSFRLSANGWNIGYITPPTQEEAVSALRPWTQQRTRWMKGFMQSYRVHMDSPLLPGGSHGLKRQVTLQLTLGCVLLAGFFHAPICLGLLIWMGHAWITQGAIDLPPLVNLSLALGYGSGLLIGAVGAIRAGKSKLLWSLPLMPLYWLCLLVPTYRAAHEYVRNPFYWAKTTHGKARQPNTPQGKPVKAKPVLPASTVPAE